MIEPEMAFCNLQDNQDLAEAFLKSQVEQVMAACRPDLEFLTKWYDPDLLKTLEGLLNSRFERITYTEAVALLKKSGRTWEFSADWGSDLQTSASAISPRNFREARDRDRLPLEIKAFYMRGNDDEKTVAAMDVLVPRIGEIIGGSQREERRRAAAQIREHAGRGLKEEATGGPGSAPVWGVERRFRNGV